MGALDSLSAGLMCTVYGLSAGMELDAKEESEGV